jgi:16S rRNA processing protein RimM
MNRKTPPPANTANTASTTAQRFALAPCADGDWPADAVEVGRVIDAYGIKGMVKVAPASADAAALLAASTWFVEHGLPRPQRYAVQTSHRKLHAGAVVALAKGVADRTQAEMLRGAVIYVSRADFPPARDGEYYWVDLIGHVVVNQQGVALGTVAGLIDNGAQGVLRVSYTTAQAKGSPREAEHLIPFVSQYVIDVAMDKRIITVDWQLDYS